MMNDVIIVTSAQKTITCRLKNNGVLHIDAIANFHCIRAPYPIKNNAQIAYDAILHSPKKIRTFVDDLDSGILPELMKIKAAVRAVERIMLSPYTYMGRKRLLREFELFITDDV